MFDIIPYQSAGPIRFGASVAELTGALGAPERIIKNLFGEKNYRYPGIGVTLSRDAQTVVEVGLTPEIDVQLGGISIFTTPDAFTQLIRQDGSPFEYMGFIILLNLGITLTGFHDHDPSQLAVTAFVKGRWEQFGSKLTPFVSEV